MLRLRTSYFRSPLVSELILTGKAKSYLVSIARYEPKWFTGDLRKIPSFAPTTDLLRKYKSGEVGADKYTEVYLNQLKKLDFNHIDLRNGDILLCYERPDEFCHRHILAEYISLIYPTCEIEELTEIK